MAAIEMYARRGVWALPIWGVLLFYGTFTHQPPYQTEFEAWSRYVTTTEFRVSHLVASILGAAIGIIGFIALSVALSPRAPRLATWALVTGVLGNTLTTAIFGVAAFAQPPSVARTWPATTTWPISTTMSMARRSSRPPRSVSSRSARR